MNPYFQFKEFTIYQDKCAMKVCTDSCLFGAAIAASEYLPQEGDILDIGCGTGLLSLMLAQKTRAFIDAVDIDFAACQQANENFRRSPWNLQIQIHNTDISHFRTGKKYKLIITNPPFYEKDLPSPNQQVNTARHCSSLTLSSLLDITGRLLADDGYFAILLPAKRTADIEEAALGQGFFIFQKLILHPTALHSPFRGIFILSRNHIATSAATLYIRDTSGSYTPGFTALLKDYYLHL